MSKEEFHSEAAYVGFRTDLEWTAQDVMTLVSSVSEIYDVFLAYRVRSRVEQSYFESIERTLQDYADLSERFLGHPMYYEVLKMWRDILKDWRKRRYPYLPPLPPLPFFPTLEARLPEPGDIFDRLNTYRTDADDLRVDRIRLASPGGFSFTGIGELIREFRELIKDLWYRNKQERARGQLEIIDKYLTMRRDYPETHLPPAMLFSTDRRLHEVIEKNIDKLRAMESSGKLKSIPENVDYRPE